VLADLGARFGAVTVVSTTHLHTDNHARGSVRAKLHEACKAVDFKINGEAKPVLAYLKSRPEVAGINVYRNNSLIHIDHNASQKAARAPSEAEPAAPVKTRKAAPVKAERKKVARTKARPRRTAAKTSPKPGGADAASE
jgi:hypothetical protein